MFSSTTPVIVTPSSKRKLPLDSGHSFGFSNKKRRSVKKNLGMDLFPSALFSGTSTPGSGIGVFLFVYGSAFSQMLARVLKCVLISMSSSLQCFRRFGLFSEYVITRREIKKATGNLCAEEEPAP